MEFDANLDDCRCLHCSENCGCGKTIYDLRARVAELEEAAMQTCPLDGFCDCGCGRNVRKLAEDTLAAKPHGTGGEDA